MKVIKYKVLGYTDVWNPETEEVEKKECLAGVERPYTEEAYQKAQKEAHNSEVTVEEVEEVLSIQEQINALKEQLSKDEK